MSVRKAKVTKLTKLIPVETEIQEPEASTSEETELDDFLNGLGGQGISEVKLYRILPSGKQKFIMSGAPGQFSEQNIQAAHGEGDYLIRSRLHGAWYRSKTFSVEGIPGVTGTTSNGSGPHSEIERLNIELNSQRLRLEQQQAQIEADRREYQVRAEEERRNREERTHELQLKMFESIGGSRNDTPPLTVTDLINGLRGLKDLNGDGNTMSSSVKEVLEIAKDLKALGGDSDGDAGSWWQPLVTEGARAVGDGLRAVAPFLPAIFAGTSNAAGVSVTAAPASPAGQPAPAPAPIAPGQAAWVPPVGAGVVVPPAPSASVPSPGMVAAQPTVQPAEIPQASTPVPQPAAPPPISPEEELQALKKQAIQIMLPYALRNANPIFCAGLAFDAIERGNIDVLRVIQELVATKNFGAWFEDMRKVEPMIFTHRDWFSELYEVVREEVAARDEALRARFGEQPVNGDKQK